MYGSAVVKYSAFYGYNLIQLGLRNGESLLHKWLRHGEIGCFYKEEMMYM